MRERSIGKLACATNVSADTIRFYERQGLLSRAARGKSGYRRYTERQLRELLVIREARSVGFTLEDIGALFSLRASDDPAQVDAVIERKLATIDRAIAKLERWRSALVSLRETGIAEGDSGHSVVPDQLLRASLLDPAEAQKHFEDMIHAS